MDLDHIDITILETLAKDAKVSAKDLADRLGLTKTPVYERIKKLERSGFIKGYRAVLDERKLGGSITVFSFVSLEAQKGHMMDAFLKAIQEWPQVSECYVMGGEFDFLMKIRVSSLDAYYEFAKSKIAALPNVGAVKSAFVLKTAKHGFALGSGDRV